MRLFSYDIFDTLITRKTASPAGIFAMIREKLVKSDEYEDIPLFLRENFFDIRISSEQRAAMWALNRGITDITIEDIYNIQGEAYGLDEDQRERLIRLECKVEKDNIIGISERIEELFALREAGSRIVLISDMYLREPMVRDILMNVDSRFRDVPIYMSSEYKKRKDSGELYYVVRDKENISFSDWNHTGDNPESDIMIPEKLGINVTKVPGKRLLPVERHLVDKYENDVYVQRIIGNSTCLRQLHDENSIKNPKAFSYGSFFLPMITDGYIRWVLEMARHQGVKTLYFIARDGYLLKAMADWWIEKKALPIKTRYIYGSRLTWRVPALSEENWSITKLCGSSDSMKYFAARDMAGMFGLSEDEFCRFLPEEIDKDVMIGTPAKKYVAECLENNNEFKEYLLKAKADERRRMKEYLAQEIDMSEKFAFVELFGGGFTQYQAAVVLHEMGVKCTTNYYYHLSRNFSDEICEFRCYIPAGKKSAPVIERMFSAPHGRTIGYKENGSGKIEPILDDESEILSEYGHEDVRRGFEEYLKNCEIIEERPKVAVLEEFEDYLIHEQDMELLEFIGDMPVDASENASDLYRFAGRMDREELRRIYQLRAFEPLNVFYSGLNYGYSWRRCSEKDKEWVKDLGWSRYKPEVIKEKEEYLAGLKLKRKYLLQYGFLPEIKGKKIALYGAGRFGGFLKEELDKEKDITCVLWVDRNAGNTKSGKTEVQPAEALKYAVFDHVLVAVMNKDVAKEIRHQLIDMGIKCDNIMVPRFS